MNLKELERQINIEILKKELNTDFASLSTQIAKTENIVKDILKDFFNINKGVYITNYKNNLFIKNVETREEITIKIKKKRSAEEVKGSYFNYYYEYVILGVEIDTTNYNSLDEYIIKVKNIIDERNDTNEKTKNEFMAELNKYNMTFDDFYRIKQIYGKLSYKDTMEFEKAYHKWY